MNPTRPSAGAAIMHAPATVFRNRCGSWEPIIRTSLLWIPVCRGLTPARADRYSNGVPDLAVEGDVRGAVGADVDEAGLAELAERRRAGVGDAEQRGGALDVELRRGGDVVLARVARPGDQEELEDAAAVVVEDDDAEVVEREPARRRERGEVVGERDVADEQHGRAARRGAPERGRDGPVDPVRAAVGDHARPAVVAGRREG